MRLQGLKNTKNFTLSLSVCVTSALSPHMFLSQLTENSDIYFLTSSLKHCSFPVIITTQVQMPQSGSLQNLFFLNLQLKTSMPFNVSWRRLSTCSKMCECSYVDSVHRSTCDLNAPVHFVFEDGSMTLDKTNSQTTDMGTRHCWEDPECDLREVSLLTSQICWLPILGWSCGLVSCVNTTLPVGVCLFFSVPPFWWFYFLCFNSLKSGKVCSIEVFCVK